MSPRENELVAELNDSIAALSRALEDLGLPPGEGERPDRRRRDVRTAARALQVDAYALALAFGAQKIRLEPTHTKQEISDDD